MRSEFLEVIAIYIFYFFSEEDFLPFNIILLLFSSLGFFTFTYMLVLCRTINSKFLFRWIHIIFSIYDTHTHTT